MTPDLGRFAVHTMTNKPWTLAQCCEAYAEAGFGGISVWRNVIEPIGIKEASAIVSSSGLEVPALVRGGFFVSTEEQRRQLAIDENLRCIDEAAAIGAKMVVLVVGAEPGTPLEDARSQVAEGIAACVSHAESTGVQLAIEPLHPMYAADKSCINTMHSAREVCERVEHPLVGVAVDVYHVWWDPDLHKEIGLLGEARRLFAFHICDWRVNTRHLLTDRALPGDGCIDIATIRRWMTESGFDGPEEIEVFSEEHWAEDQHAFLAKLRRSVS